jgi:hypothetical protein
MLRAEPLLGAFFFMTIQLEDKKLKARISPAGLGGYRLVIEFPGEPEYERIVKEVFVHLLRTRCEMTDEERPGDERR